MNKLTHDDPMVPEDHDEIKSEELAALEQEVDGLKVALEQKMQGWGIQVQSVEIRDVIIPPSLEDAMSRQAQAERERQARIQAQARAGGCDRR